MSEPLRNPKQDPALLLVFIVSLCMFLCLLLIALAEPVSNGAGNAHGSLAGMNVGGDGAIRLANIGTWAFLFNCGLYTLFVALCALAIRQDRRDSQLYLMLGATLFFMLLVWWQMYFGHQKFLETGTTSYALGFPVPTAWQLYGTWISGIPLTLIYSIWFTRYIFTEEDDARFKELLVKNGKG